MGTSGLVGQIMTWQTMTVSESPVSVLIKILLFHFILPAIVTLVFSEAMQQTQYDQKRRYGIVYLEGWHNKKCASLSIYKESKTMRNPLREFLKFLFAFMQYVSNF